MKLTEHFTLAEMIDSQTAARLGLDNTPTPEIIDHLRLLCTTILEPARMALGPLRISSGYRSRAVDVAVKGHAASDRDDSAHMYGFAADVIPVEVSKLTFARWVTQWVPFDQVILEFGTREQPAWIHVSARPPLRAEVLRILAGTGYEPASLA